MNEKNLNTVTSPGRAESGKGKGSGEGKPLQWDYVFQTWEYHVPKPEPLTFVCAWCQSEQKIKPEPGQSHGICKMHYHQMLAQLKKAI